MNINRLVSSADLEEVFTSLNEDIFAYVMARVRAREIAEDIAQEVFIKAWEKRSQFNPDKGSLKNWIYAIALNAVRDHFRRNRIRATVELPEEISSDEDIARQTDTKASAAFILEHMKSLSAKEQELLTLRFMQELSIEEVAEVMKMKYSATKVALHRATKKLQDRCNRFSP